MAQKIWKTALLAVKAFFGIGAEDSVASGSKKVAVTAGRRVVYLFVDYWAAFACAALVSTLKFWGRSQMEIILATFVYDFVVAAAFLVAAEKSGHDITLGESFRRAADVIRSSHKIAGYVTFGWLTIKAIIWDGPEQVVVFFKKEIGDGLGRMILILIPLALVQGIFWAWVYGLGYDSVSELIKRMF